MKIKQSPNVTYNIHGFDYTISITQFQIYLFDSQGVPQELYRRNKNENMHQPLCIDYPNVTSGIHELSAKTYLK